MSLKQQISDIVVLGVISSLVLSIFSLASQKFNVGCPDFCASFNQKQTIAFGDMSSMLARQDIL